MQKFYLFFTPLHSKTVCAIAYFLKIRTEKDKQMKLIIRLALLSDLDFESPAQN